MKRYALLLVTIFLLGLFAGCKTTDKGDPTKFTISDKTSEDEMRAYMEGLFNNIEKKIALGDFDGWNDAISREYKYYINDYSVLKQMSEDSDYLYNRGITLKSARDYFTYVVIHSREGKLLEFDDYEYIDKYHVKVICLFDKQQKFVYNFIYEDNSWKLDR
jgi:hypothetical protein